MLNAYLKELIETCTFYLLNIGCYDWIVSARSGTPSNYL
jgi:hypothetical protein